jgi:hypothetical protein
MRGGFILVESNENPATQRRCMMEPHSELELICVDHKSGQPTPYTPLAGG